jgi:hypothetical protein
MTQAYYLQPVESQSQIYYLEVVKGSSKVYYLIPVGAQESAQETQAGQQEEWIHFDSGGFSANEMLNSNTYVWSDTPGDYTNSMGSVTIPGNVTAVKLVPLSGAQCFNRYTNLWTVRIKFKTMLDVSSLDSFREYGKQTTKGAAEADYLNLSPIVLRLGQDKQLHWGFTDRPLTDNTDDKAYFNIYYKK